MSAGGSGARPHLEWCLDIVRDIAREENLHFKLGIAEADIPKETVLTALENGQVSSAFYSSLTPAVVEESENIVAQMGETIGTIDVPPSPPFNNSKYTKYRQIPFKLARKMTS